MDNPENTEGAITNGQSRETDKIGYHKTKQNKTKIQFNMWWIPLSTIITAF